MKIDVTKYAFVIGAQANEKITFAFVSDLHGCESEPVLDILSSLSPSALLVGGDYIHSKTEYRKGIEFLVSASKRFPTFVSIGNHERKTVENIEILTKETGAKLLDNSSDVFMGINIGGLSSGYGKNEKQSKFKKPPAPDTEFLKEFSTLPGYKILLCHHPEYYDGYIKELPVDLTLCGHAHGGQWRFFGKGLFAPGQGIFPKYTSGLYDNRMIVARGLGNPIAIPRINNKPEIVFIELS